MFSALKVFICITVTVYLSFNGVTGTDSKCSVKHNKYFIFT